MTKHYLFPGGSPISAETVGRFAYVADVSCGSKAAGLYITKDGLPLIVMDALPPDADTIRLPAFWELDEICAAQTFEKDGQSSLVTDVLVKRGLCTYRTGPAMRLQISENLSTGRFIILVKERR